MTGWMKGKKVPWLRRALGILAALMLLAPLGIRVAAAQQTEENPPWLAPDDAKQVKNPVKRSPEGLTAAAQLFRENCALCHGKTGAGDGPAGKALNRKPADFTDAKTMKKLTDGELFYKMTTGRLPMPSWAQLSDTQRWELVNYLRTLSGKAAAPKKEE
jgi:mono/diheme cytochrome c family protein